MKKVVLFALLLAAVTAASAHAIDHEPLWGASYYCDYSNYSGNASDPGFSTWHTPVRYYPGGTLLIRAKETFTTSYGSDTYNVSWAKPVTPLPTQYKPTTWEFTFSGGPQCKKTIVSADSTVITFNECTDGHSRICYLW